MSSLDKCLFRSFAHLKTELPCVLSFSIVTLFSAFELWVPYMFLMFLSFVYVCISGFIFLYAHYCILHIEIILLFLCHLGVFFSFLIASTSTSNVKYKWHYGKQKWQAWAFLLSTESYWKKLLASLLRL